MRLLFVKDELAWPRSSGHDVHCFHMMRALAELGHDVSLATVGAPLPEALAGLKLTQRYDLQTCAAGANGCPPLTYMQERFRSYWGIEPARISAVGKSAHSCGADAVIAVGLNVLPYLAGVQDAVRIWYAADEWAWHHLTQVRVSSRATWPNVRQALVKGWYERVYAPCCDRVWVVSETERRAMKWFAGMRAVDVLPNGVDADYYHPPEAAPLERSCVFWGRLDFGPNIQALEWFCRHVWPALRKEAPAARFTILGFKPTATVEALARQEGIALIADLPDIRAEVARHALVVLPFVSGGGIKNKLLEAAALGKAIVCTPRACCGLQGPSLPLVQARTPKQWVQEILALWADHERHRRLGDEARRWVIQHHAWSATAQSAAVTLESSLKEKQR